VRKCRNWCNRTTVSRLLHVLCGRLQSRRAEQFVRVRMVPRPLLGVSESALLLRRRCDDECGALLFDIAGAAHTPATRTSLPQRAQRACHARTAFKGRDAVTSTHRCEGITLRVRIHRNVGMVVLPDDAFVQLVSQSNGAAADEHELNSGMVVVVGLFDRQELLH